MKRFNKQLLALALVATGSSNASALCCGDGPMIVAAIGVSTTALIAEIAGSSMSAAKVIIGGVSASVTQSAEMITENDNKLTTRVRAIETMRQRRIQDPCIMIAAAKAPGVQAAAANAGSSYGRGGSGAPLAVSGRGAPGGVSGASRTNMLSIATGKEPSPATEVLASNAARWACDEFARSNPLRAKSCDAAGMAAGNGASRPDADIRAETLFDGPQEEYGKTKLRRTIAADGNDRLAVEAYLRNLSSPLDLRQLEKGELKTEDGRRFLAVKDTYEARMSLATRGLRDVAGQKTESVSTIPAIQAMLKSETAKDYVNGRLGAIPGWSSKGVSPQELRALEAERRHMNVKWRDFLAKASEQEIAAEQLQIGAYQIVLQTEMLEEMGRMRAEFSNLSAGAVRSEMLPVLKAQHAAATR